MLISIRILNDSNKVVQCDMKCEKTGEEEINLLIYLLIINVKFIILEQIG